MTDRSRRRIFVTGAASGIGRAEVGVFLNAGASVGAFNRDAGALDTTKADRLVTLPGDVTDPASVTAALAAMDDRLAPLVVPAMQDCGGRIVNMSGDAAMAGDVGLTDHVTAKWGSWV